MLILAKITTTGAGGYATYLEGKARALELGDYYLKDGERVEAPGRWAQGAEQFSLDASQRVTAEHLHTLMDVRRPDSGQPLRRVGGSGTAVSAIDATFSAPKTVSSVWALAGPDLRAKIEQAHESAIDAALKYATAQVPMLRRRVAIDSVVHEKAGGLIATSWRHSSARAVQDQVPDPQLHSHVLLHGAVRRNGEIAAIDSRAWLVHQREVGAAYRSHLARELHRLGFEIQRGTGRGGRYFELAGVPQALTDRWSSRHQQVQTAISQRLVDQARELKHTISADGPQAADAAGQLKAMLESGLSPAQERMMGTITRSTKLPVTTEDLDSEWRRTAHDLGLTRQRIEMLRQGERPDLEAAAERDLLDGLTEFDATFPARDARAVALERSAGIPIPDALAQLVTLRDSEQILLLADGTGTTRTHRGKERAVVAIVERMTQARVDPLPVKLVETEARRLNDELSTHGGKLSAEQRAAILLACADRPLVVIQGQAGTGKSTALTGIARAHQAAGREITVTSTAALAAQRLSHDLQDAGVECAAYSTQALHNAISSGQITLGPHSTVIHDEAALASTSEQAAILEQVEHSGARIIAVGDPAQNQPVGAGGLWAATETATRHADAHVELTVNQRAHDPADRSDQARFRNGQAEHAIRSYAARDHIHLDPEQRRAEDRALEGAHADRTAGLHTMVIVQTSNQHLDQLNARAQAIRAQAGELGADGLKVPGRPYSIHAGDQVQIRRTLRRPDQEPLINGTSGQIVDINSKSRTVDLQITGTDTISLSEQEIADADLRLAYVQHPFPAQGQTTDTTHLLISDHSTHQGAYVGLTRARQRTDIYSAEPTGAGGDEDRLARLAATMSRTEPEMASIVVPLAHEQQVIPDLQIEVGIELPVIEVKSRDGLMGLASGQDAGGRQAVDASGTRPLLPREVSESPMDQSELVDPDPAVGLVQPREAPMAAGLEMPFRMWPRTVDDKPNVRELDALDPAARSVAYEP